MLKTTAEKENYSAFMKHLLACRKESASRYNRFLRSYPETGKTTAHLHSTPTMDSVKHAEHYSMFMKHLLSHRKESASRYRRFMHQ